MYLFWVQSLNVPHFEGTFSHSPSYVKELAKVQLGCLTLTIISCKKDYIVEIKSTIEKKEKVAIDSDIDVDSDVHDI